MARFSEAVAPKGFAPLEHQSPTPPSIFSPRGVPVGNSEDLQRILQLPRRKPLDLKSIAAEAMVEHEMEKYSLGPKDCKCAEIDRQIALGNRKCVKRLLPLQAWSLYEAKLAGGLFCCMPVGSGKTVLAILGVLALGVPNALLLIPPTLIDQLILDYELIAQHFVVPGILVHRGKYQEPYRGLIEGRPLLHVLAYSQLSGTENSDWIDKLQPAALIMDECDALSDIESARTKRVRRFFMGPDDMSRDERISRFRRIKAIAMSGSVSNSSILEYGHLIAWCLKVLSPLPLDENTMAEWSRCLDASNNPSPPGQLLKMCNPGEEVRSGFRRRLSETLGVIITDSNEVTTTTIEGGERVVDLQIRERQAPAIPAIIQTALDMVRKFQRPDTLGGSKHNEEIVEKLEQARYAQQVATGIFYKWIFPRGEPDDLIDEWFEARKRWNKELRHKLQDGHEFLDSPKLCETAARRAWGEIEVDPLRPIWKSVAWPRWARVKDKVEPKTKAVRLHDFLVQDAVAWGREKRGIIWYSMVEFGQWVAEISGFPLHQGGPKAGERLRQETGDKSIIASIKSHGRGRDGLQHLFNTQLISQTPASTRAYEQLIARVHRRGQKHHLVTTEVYLHTDEVRESFQQAMRCAGYVTETFGQSQKLLKGYREGSPR